MKLIKTTKILFVSFILTLGVCLVAPSVLPNAGIQDCNYAEAKQIDYYDMAINAIEALSDDSYEDGTYDIATYETVEYEDGYQVTFCQIGDNYSKDEFNWLCKKFVNASSDGKICAGKFGGTPEISFNVAKKKKAIKLAQKFNQMSIWDWAACDEISTGGTGIRSLN